MLLALVTFIDERGRRTKKQLNGFLFSGMDPSRYAGFSSFHLLRNDPRIWKFLFEHSWVYNIILQFFDLGNWKISNSSSNFCFWHFFAIPGIILLFPHWRIRTIQRKLIIKHEDRIFLIDFCSHLGLMDGNNWSQCFEIVIVMASCYDNRAVTMMVAKVPMMHLYTLPPSMLQDQKQTSLKTCFCIFLLNDWFSLFDLFDLSFF